MERREKRIGGLRELWALIREDMEWNGTVFEPGFQALAVHRFGVWKHAIQPKALRIPFTVIYRLLNVFVRNVYGIELYINTRIGRRVTIVHQHGIVIHPNAAIGDDCLIRQGVTIGHYRDTRGSPLPPPPGPKLGKRVKVGVGAVIAGDIVIGDDVHIGPNAVVMTDVPARSTVTAPLSRIMPRLLIDDQVADADIEIGNDAWLGARAAVLPDARIGSGAVAAAGSVVRGTIPSFAMAAGNLAAVGGRRRNPADVAGRLADGEEANPAILARIQAEVPGLDATRLAGPLEAAGIDSFDLITLRTALEERYGLTIPDRDWGTIRSLADIARLPSLRGAGEGPRPLAVAKAQVAPPAQAAAASSEPAPGAAAPGAMAVPPALQGGALLPAPGRSLRVEADINLPQMALSGLSEAWLFKELGDIHWAMITSFLKTPSSAIADDRGDRLYATFTRILVELDPSLRGFRENDSLEIASALERHGAGLYFGSHRLASAGATGFGRTMSTFAKYGERGRNTSLIKGTPTLPDPEAISSLEALPEFGAEYRRRRAAEPQGSIFECDYEILPPHDINGVGLLYFAAYPTVFDLCIERFEGKGFLLGHSTVSKDICYYANSEPTEMLRFRLHAREEEADGLIRHTASLFRTSDLTRMGEVTSLKRRLG